MHFVLWSCIHNMALKIVHGGFSADHGQPKIAGTQSSSKVTRRRQQNFLILYRCILDSLFNCKTAIPKARVPGKNSDNFRLTLQKCLGSSLKHVK